MAKLYKNNWAGYETYFVPLYPARTARNEANAVSGYELTFIDGKWECRKGSYYCCSLRDEEKFPVIGDVKIDINGYVKGIMLTEVTKWKGKKCKT